MLCLHNVPMLNLGGFGSGSISKSLNCLMAYQQRTKKKLCKVSICLFLSGIVNSICALFVTRCSPLYNPGRSHPAQFSFHWHNLILPQGQETIKMNSFDIMFQMLFLLYQTFVKHVKDFSKASLHKSWKCTAFLITLKDRFILFMHTVLNGG